MEKDSRLDGKIIQHFISYCFCSLDHARFSCVSVGPLQASIIQPELKLPLEYQQVVSRRMTSSRSL